MIQVVASYADGDGDRRSRRSAQRNPSWQSKAGDLVVTLMQLDAPPGASTINPLTTLVQDAIELGLSPNTAALAIKTVLGLPDAINLQTYDAYAVLQSDPTDATALAVEKVAVQVAILTSLSDDDTGTNLTLAILDAAAANQTLDLANVERPVRDPGHSGGHRSGHGQVSAAAGRDLRPQQDHVRRHRRRRRRDRHRERVAGPAEHPGRHRLHLHRGPQHPRQPGADRQRSRLPGRWRCRTRPT